MRKTIYCKVLFGLLSLIFLLPSCAEQNEVEEPTLELSETSLVLSKEAVEKQVSVQTNQKEWSCFSPQEDSWIGLKQEGNTLKINIQANNTPEERKGTIIVIAGIQRKIIVTQSAGEANVVFDSDEAKLDEFGGKVRVNYTGGAKAAVEIPADATEWLKVSMVTDGYFVLDVAKNTGKEVREAKVFVTVGKTVREFSVKQEGAMYFVLPLFGSPARPVDMKQFEESRGNFIARLPDEVFNKTSYVVLTRSKVMPVIEYEYAKRLSGTYGRAVVACREGAILTTPEFEEFMKKSGFEKTQSENTELTATYLREDDTDTYVAEVLVDEEENTGAVIIKRAEKQKEYYPTFGAVPMGEQTLWIGSRKYQKRSKKNREEVKAWELKRGSKEVEGADDPEFHGFQVTDDKDIAFRAYYYVVAKGKPGEKGYIPADDEFIGTLNETVAMYPNTTLAYWVDSDKNLVLTKEVLRFLAEKGIHFYRRQSTNDIFYDEKNKIAYAFSIRKNLYNYKELLNVSCFYIELNTGSSLIFRSENDIDRVLKARYENEQRIEEALGRMRR